jgi:hypothetical protein
MTFCLTKHVSFDKRTASTGNKIKTDVDAMRTVAQKRPKTKRTTHPLALLFSSAARNTLLRIFLTDPKRGYYQRQVEAVTGLPIRAIQRETQRLHRLGLLFRRVEGNRVYFQVNPTFPWFAELRALVLKDASQEERLRATLAVQPGLRIALLHRKSKMLFLVGENERTAIEALANNGFAFKTKYFSEEEFLARLNKFDTEFTRCLMECEDILGRREDTLWRYVESVGIAIPKGAGVP